MTSYDAKCPGCGIPFVFHVPDELISIETAAAKGIEKLRMPAWANPTDYLKVDIIDGKPGPWTHLYSDSNMEINGQNPVSLMCINMDYKTPYYMPFLPVRREGTRE
jgi:hypothetical protein